MQPYLDTNTHDGNIALAFASLCRHVDRCNEAVACMQRLIAEDGSPLEAYSNAMLHVALGRLLDAAEEYDLAFDHYRRGNELSRRHFDLGHHKRHIDALIDACGASFMTAAPRAPHGSRRPLFIVGMPRSGTSLVEQILASHPEALGGGEIDEIYRIAPTCRTASARRCLIPSASRP